MLSPKELQEMKEKIDALYSLFFPEKIKTAHITEIKLQAQQAVARSLKKKPLKVVK